VNEDLSFTKAHLLILLSRNMSERVRGRGVLQENDVCVFRFSLGKRIGLQNSQHFGCRTHYNTNGLPGIGMQSAFKLGLHL
jgi:hypothetical protein